MRLLELFEQSGKTAAVAFGRMNPPTIGHQKVVDAILKQKADAHFLFVSQTHKPSGKNKTRLENPLPFDVKLGFIQQAFPNIDIGDTSVGTAIGILQSLEKQGFENVVFVCGSDRVPAFTELFNKQNGIDYNLKSIKIVSSGARDPDAEGAEGMSASKMRAAAIANDFESFKTGLPAGLISDAEEVFSAVRQGLEPWLEQGVAEDSLDEFSVGGGDGDRDEDPYKYPKPKSYRRSIDFFGQFEADHFDREDMNDATGEFKGYWGKNQIAYFKFDNPTKTGSDDSGMGWYYEPQSDLGRDDTGARPSVNNSKERKQQELSMINAFLKSGNRPKPGSQIYNLMKQHGMVETSLD